MKETFGETHRANSQESLIIVGQEPASSLTINSPMLERYNKPNSQQVAQRPRGQYMQGAFAGDASKLAADTISTTRKKITIMSKEHLTTSDKS